MIITPLRLLFLFAIHLHLVTLGVSEGTNDSVSPAAAADWKRRVAAKWNASARDCSNFVPLWEQTWLAANPPPSPSIYIPMDYLHDCMKNVSYDRTVAPFELDIIPRIQYSFGVCEVHDLMFDGTLRLKGSFYFEWEDHRLRYKENVTFAKGSGWRFVDHFEIPAKELWTPIFRLANCKTTDCLVAPTNETIARLSSDGRADYWVQTLLTATCEMKLQNFPFDQQNCVLLFILPDLHRGTSYKLEPLNTTYLEYMYENDEWVLEGVTHNPLPNDIWFLEPIFEGNTTRQNGSWKCNRTRSQIISFQANLTLSRHPDFYLCNLIIPTLVVTIVDLLTVFVPNSREGKIELSVTILLAFIFLQGLVAATTPKQPDTPLLGMYILFALILSGVNLLVVVVTLWVYNYGADRSVPPLLLRIFGIRIWRWPMQAVRFLLRSLCNLCCKRCSSGSRQSSAANDDLTIEAEPKQYYERPGHTTGPDYKESDNGVDRTETWEVFARYQEMIASALFLALQALIFLKYLYPLLELWAFRQQNKPYIIKL